MAEISVGMEVMYEKQQTQRDNKKNYKLPVALLTVGVVGAVMPTPMNLYVWGAGAAGLALIKGLENEIA